MALHERWTRHLKTESEKTYFRKYIADAQTVLQRLDAILDEYGLELEEKDLLLTEYDSPAFPYLKADRNGERRMLKKLKQLLLHLKD